MTYYDESDLYAFNTDGIAGFYVDGLDPGAQYVLLSYVNTGEEGSDSEWKWASARVAFAPSVTFTQSVTGGDGYADFKWIGGKSGVYAIGEVVYAFVPASEFAATGLDASNIGNPNDLEAREAAGEDVTADAATAVKIDAFLAASGKTLKDDALKPVNTADGFSRRFADLSAGDYVLVSRAADSYNTKITVSPVTVR